MGFNERVRGDHHIFTRDGVAEILNLQPLSGKAKAYQVKQVRGVLTLYRLADQPESKRSIPEGQSDEEHGRTPEEEDDGG